MRKELKMEESCLKSKDRSRREALIKRENSSSEKKTRKSPRKNARVAQEMKMTNYFDSLN